MERIDIIIGVIVLLVLYIWIGLLMLYAISDWLKGRSILWYVALMMLWPIVFLVFLFAFPWIMLCEIFKEGKKDTEENIHWPSYSCCVKMGKRAEKQ